MVLELMKRLIGRKPLQLGSPEANKLVITHIAKDGDNGLSERHVRHFAYPVEEQRKGDKLDVFEVFTDAGLGVSDSEFRGGVLGEHDSAVATAEFDQLTDGLRVEMEKLGWVYDGWECAILRD